MIDEQDQKFGVTLISWLVRACPFGMQATFTYKRPHNKKSRREEREMCLMLRTHTIELGLIYRGISFYHIPSDVQNFRNQILKLIPDQPENFKALDSNIFSYMQKKTATP